MATLTKSTGTVTLSGAAEKVTLPAVYGWVWFWNMSDSDMFAGTSADISQGADGVATIPAGGCRRIQTDGFNSVYLLGTGNVQISAQNYADCPFKVGSKGGGNGGSGQELVLLKHEDTAYSTSSSYVFNLDADFNVSDYKMFICIIKGIGSGVFTPELTSVKFRGEGENIYQIQWLRNSMFQITNTSGTAFSYFSYQLFGVKG
ncbi:MAG: hypothetical protein J5999_05685 [Oscillospiraceae bacterium]|nr:hypothetical protein [Oscillospiraceae bacterium]